MTFSDDETKAKISNYPPKITPLAGTVLGAMGPGSQSY